MGEYIGKALQIAWEAHFGQKDKGGRPYIRHPLSVAGRMDTEYEIITALLHDVAEDTEVSLEDLRNMGFPEEILKALSLLTHDPEEDYMDYIRRIRSNELARRVKLADLWHNSQAERLGREPSEKDLRRLEKYAKAMEILRCEE